MKNATHATVQPSTALVKLIAEYVHQFRSVYKGLAVVEALVSEGLYDGLFCPGERYMATLTAADRAASRYLPQGYASRISAENAFFVHAVISKIARDQAFVERYGLRRYPG